MSAYVVQTDLQVLGTGERFPSLMLNSDELVGRFRDNLGFESAPLAKRIAKTMGIEERRLVRDLTEPREKPRDNESNPDLAAGAVHQALEDAQVEAQALQYLIGHTASPHTFIPPNISWVADRLGYGGPYGEFRQACTGFANALVMSNGLLSVSGEAPVAIVGSETGSVFCDLGNLDADRGQFVNAVQMGDGSAAVILKRANGDDTSRIELVFFGQLKTGAVPGFSMSEGASGAPALERRTLHFDHDFNSVRSEGPELFAQGLSTLKQLDIDINAMDWIIPHQANGRIDQVMEEALGIPREKVIVDANVTGNLGSAAIWVSFHRLRTSDRIKRGDRVLVLGAEATKYMFGGFIYRH